MNAKKAKGLRKLIRHAHSHRPIHELKEMGENSRLVETGTGPDGKPLKTNMRITATLVTGPDGKPLKTNMRITATLVNAQETQRGQYIAMKRWIKAEYGK